MSAINNLILMGMNGALSVHSADEPISVSVPENTLFQAFILQLSGSVQLSISLDGAQAQCAVQALYLSAGQTRSQLTLDVNHAHPQTFSEQKIKGVLTDETQMDFKGIIRIPRHSQKCAGAQNHRALILSDRALVRATPELEIFADDVQCAHGSAIAALDEKQLFYLMSRGMDEIQARRLLIQAFIMDITPDVWISDTEQWMAKHV